MMFTPPRFVVVDDNPDHLTAILDVFQALGTPCLGVVYDPERELESRHFQGVRALFLDLHLTDLAATTDERRHFAIIAGILEQNISPTGGPFILVVWSEHDDLIGELTDYLDESLDRLKPYVRPLAIVSLPKSRFINLDTGESNAGQAGVLHDAVEKAVSSKPQLAALVAWETDVQAAASATLSALVDLVPENLRNSTSFAENLGQLLTRLAREFVGQFHVAADPRAAITSALAPILADRIVNEKASDTSSRLWKKALTSSGWGTSKATEEKATPTCPVTGRPLKGRSTFSGHGTDAKAKSILNRLLGGEMNLAELIGLVHDVSAFQYALNSARRVGVTKVNRPSRFFPDDRRDSNETSGRINRMLHMAIPPSETIRSTDWGAVVEFPDVWCNDDEMRRRFGVTRGQLFGSEFKIGKNDRGLCRLRLVRIGAACDHAQNRSGPLTYLLGLEIPRDVQRKADNTGKVRVPASEWSSPTLLLEPGFGPFFLAVNARYSMSVARGDAEAWQSVYRFREQLLMHLISHATSYLARPGIVRF